jgi:hypothetical protein
MMKGTMEVILCKRDSLLSDRYAPLFKFLWKKMNELKDDKSIKPNLRKKILKLEYLLSALVNSDSIDLRKNRYLIFLIKKLRIEDYAIIKINKDMIFDIHRNIYAERQGYAVVSYSNEWIEETPKRINIDGDICSGCIIRHLKY